MEIKDEQFEFDCWHHHEENWPKGLSAVLGGIANCSMNPQRNSCTCFHAVKNSNALLIILGSLKNRGASPAIIQMYTTYMSLKEALDFMRRFRERGCISGKRNISELTLSEDMALVRALPDDPELQAISPAERDLINQLCTFLLTHMSLLPPEKNISDAYMALWTRLLLANRERHGQFLSMLKSIPK